jgi:hypothetical protein
MISFLINRIVTSTHALIFRLISFLRHCMVMSTNADRALLKHMVEQVRSQVLEELSGNKCG